MARRLRTREQNQAIYQRRKQRDLEAGFSSPSAKARALKNQPESTSAYYQSLAYGKGRIGRRWQDLAASTELDVSDRQQAESFARMLNKRLHTRSFVQRRRITAQWVQSLDLSAMESEWLMYQLGDTP